MIRDMEFEKRRSVS